GELALQNQTWLLPSGAVEEARLNRFTCQGRSILDSSILRLLRQTMVNSSPLYNQYCTMFELVQMQNIPEYSIRFFINPGDGLNFEPPTGNHQIMAALCDGDLNNERGAFIYRKVANQQEDHRFINYVMKEGFC